ncbi:MAG: dihydroorotase [Fibrobacterota bacterium]
MAENTLLIKNGLVISPADKINGVADILIADGKIVKVRKGIRETADTVIDAKGCWVLPGLIDMHVHLREPGREDKETVKTGTAAAAAGGITAVAAMANTEPVVDNETVVKFILDRAKEGSVHVYPVGAVTRNMEGEALAEIGLMRRAGIVALSDDGKSVMNSGVMKNALRYSLMDDLPVLCHCEDANLGKGVVNSGKTATALGLAGVPRSAEEIMVARDIMLARETGACIHIQHVSTRGSVELIRRAKKEGVRVTAETAPHYFTLTDEVIRTFNTHYRVNPPLRGEEDRDALIAALRDGTLDCIATDHAPHTVDDKDQEFDQAPSGMVGLETSVGVTLTELVHKKKITASRMIELMSVNPARILKVPGGTLKMGSLADVTVINPNLNWTVDSSKFLSKGRNTPFEGKKLKGKAVATLVAGRVVYKG